MLETDLWRGAWGVIHSTPMPPLKRYTGARHVLAVVLQFFTDFTDHTFYPPPPLHKYEEVTVQWSVQCTRMYKLHTCLSEGYSSRATT